MRKKVQLLVILTILAWATQTLMQQWGFGQELSGGEKFVPGTARFAAGATEINIAESGIVEVSIPGQEQKQNVGQLQISQFINPQGLHLLGGSIYTKTGASGEPIDSNPGDDGAGIVLQGFLEASNVDPVKELVTLIKTQRAFELNSQSIQTADQALQTIGNLRRG
jgi:flagellar basal-body rod protein FlgG